MIEPVTVGELLALLAHDLKNPLAAVLTNLAYARGFVDALPPDAQADDVREALLDARLASESVQRFANNLELLAVEVSGSGGRRDSLPPLGLGSLVDEAVARQRPHADARRIQITTEAEPGVDGARIDQDNVLRSLENLVANAVQHAPTGSVIRVRTARDGNDVVVEVVDDGSQVPPALETAALTAEGQVRLKADPSARYGRGVGLFAAAVAARLSGAVIELGRRDGASVLRLRIPRHDGEW